MRHNCKFDYDSQVLRQLCGTSRGSTLEILAILVCIDKSDSLKEYASTSALTAIFTLRELRLLDSIARGEGVFALCESFGLGRQRVRQIQRKVERKLTKIVGRVSEIYALEHSLSHLNSSLDSGNVLAFMSGVNVTSFSCGVNLSLGGIATLEDLTKWEKREILQIRRVGPVSYSKFIDSLKRFKTSLRSDCIVEQNVALELKRWMKNNA